jgi:hypothetical protein
MRLAQRAFYFAREPFRLSLGERTVDRTALLVEAGELGGERIARQHSVLEYNAYSRGESASAVARNFSLPGL